MIHLILIHSDPDPQKIDGIDPIQRSCWQSSYNLYQINESAPARWSCLFCIRGKVVPSNWVIRIVCWTSWFFMQNMELFRRNAFFGEQMCSHFLMFVFSGVKNKKYRNKLVRCLHPGLLSVKVDGYLVVTVIRFANPHFGSDIRRHLPVKVGPILNQWNLSVVCVKLYFFCLIFRVPPHPATVGIITCLPGDPHLNQISPLESWEGVRIPMYNTAPLKLTFIATENSVSPPKKNHLPTIHFQGPC